MKCYCDRFFYLSIILAHILIYTSFTVENHFWVVFALSQFILILIAVKREQFKWWNIQLNETFIGLVSGIILYLFFFIGKQTIIFFHIPLLADLQKLHQEVNPSQSWHYLLLFLIIIPAEEIFWRGYIQKRLSYYTSPVKGIIFASLLYASANIYANSILLIISAIVAGIFWGILYHWKKSIWVPIISHSIFNLLLLIIYPIF